MLPWIIGLFGGLDAFVFAVVAIVAFWFVVLVVLQLGNELGWWHLS